MTPRDALESLVAEGPLPTDDVLDRLLPLMRALSLVHDEGRVGNLEGLTALLVDADGTWSLDKAPASPKSAPAELQRVEGDVSRALEVVHRGTVRTDIGAGGVSYDDHSIGADDGPITFPVHLRGYRTWEGRVGHRDALTDIFVLGLLLGSLACGLDLLDENDHRDFVDARGDLFRLNPDLNPVLARTIREMTEVDRHRRAQDLRNLVARLEAYRDQPEDFDLIDVGALTESTPERQREVVLQRLRNRLFDPSRRNRLLYFRATQQMLDLTQTSVPQRLDHKRIRADQLLTWHRGVADVLATGKPLKLSSYLQFDDNAFLTGSLDKIISQARRDKAEYGFAQLRLVVSFLRWHDLKGVAAEIVDSPLLLVPVQLSKKKGVRDTYGLEALASEAEVNPSLRQRLADLYAIRLPERVELSWGSVADFHAELIAQVQASEPAVSVQMVEQPRIDLIQRQARLRAEVFLRRRRGASAGRPAVTGDYSYKTDDYRPRGITLFLSQVRPSPLPQRVTAGGTEELRTPAAAPVTSAPMITQDTYTLRKGAQTGNPYEWEIDLCRLTVGNFNYRRMSLVQDYERLLRSPLEGTGFDAVFNPEGRPLDSIVESLPTAEQHLVVEGDSTQLRAVSQGRYGTSYIIQGPPGTGKSQTITNLIADFVSVGKRVLFVCEKRAAVDVVFHRLRQSGLDSLCSLIHDSQADKRSFVMDLKASYEGHLAVGDAELEAYEEQRDGIVEQIETELEALHRLTKAMADSVPGTDVAATSLLDDLVVLRGELGHDPLEALTAEDVELLPSLVHCRTAATAARAIERSLADLGESPILSDHPVISLSTGVISAQRPQRAATDLVARARRQADALAAAMGHTDLPETLADDLAELSRFSRTVGDSLQPLGDIGALDLLDPSQSRSRSFDSLVVEHHTATEAAIAADAAATEWSHRPDLATAQEALAAASQFEGKALAGMRGPWRQARKLVAEHYRGELAAAEALALLVRDREAQAAVAALSQRCADTFGSPDVNGLDALVSTGRALRSSPVDVVATAVARPSSPTLARLIDDVLAVTPELDVLQRTLRELLADPESLPGGVTELQATLERLESELDLIPPLLDLLRDLSEADPAATEALRVLPLTAAAIEFASGRVSLDRFFAADRSLARLDGSSVERRIEAVAELRRELLSINAQVIRERTRSQFLEHVRISAAAANHLSAAEKALKKDYTAGRKELEHEFGKVMRHKSIRDLVGGPAKAVISDLKPVWLMSPLSVSDTLPLESDLFDVVIYDEASQIPVEEAVPALHRAPQVIVVGDQMQLPPTSFFGSKDDDEDEQDEDLDGAGISLDGTSFLNQSTATLPSVLLAWHYRSRSEELIGFSNAAFYGGELRTVPNRTVASSARSEILVPTKGKLPGAGTVLDRPISFHRLEHGVYADRRNTAEAAYIAELVRDLLSKNTGKSVGIVAFSEAQQGAIEDAMSALAAKDRTFATRLEEESEREEDDQFVGLFIKNLENVQGDERDIVILSICYAPDRNGRMRMNFGPINAADGEKRLNVIFSRSKHHMAVVSSIRHDAITNDWNDGANALKDFLRYAEASSRGEHALASSVLQGYLPRSVRPESSRPLALVQQVAAVMTKAGCVVETNVGASSLRCDLALRAPTDSEHRVAVMVDHRTGLDRDDHERWIDQPRAFDANGWAVAHLLAKDWLLDQDAVVERLLGKLGRKPRRAPARTAKAPTPVAPPPLPAPRRRQIRPPAPVIEVAEELDEEIAIEAVVEAVAPVAKAPAPRKAAARKPTTAAPSNGDLTLTPRRLEFVEGTSAKFWVVWREDLVVHVRFGRIGTEGQHQIKDMPTEAAAIERIDKLIREKQGKGYVSVDPS